MRRLSFAALLLLALAGCERARPTPAQRAGEPGSPPAGRPAQVEIGGPQGGVHVDVPSGGTKVDVDNSGVHIDTPGSKVDVP